MNGVDLRSARDLTGRRRSEGWARARSTDDFGVQAGYAIDALDLNAAIMHRLGLDHKRLTYLRLTDERRRRIRRQSDILITSTR